MMMPPPADQRPIRMRESLLVFSSCSQLGPWMPTDDRMMFSRPLPGLKIQIQRMVAATKPG